ncbi:hypothetical protein BKA03_000568 [Demequina lutea]|uniref:Uncharacterized protein n=1 Tax=Demequina lutea TaxID=431489 RepID=A0A7Y9Z7U1_9MICO|nr:hypothetical protein [Demequina lutea]
MSLTTASYHSNSNLARLARPVRALEAVARHDHAFELAAYATDSSLTMSPEIGFGSKRSRRTLATRRLAPVQVAVRSS